MRYLIDGCYGDGNVGDECLLRAVVRLVRFADPDAEIAAFSSDAAATTAETGLPAIEQCNPFGRNIHGAVIKGLLRKAISQIRQSDVFILGGGELFRDHSGLKATLGILYRMCLARLLGKRVFAISMGIQAPTTLWGRIVLRNALRVPESLVCRDPDALAIARQLAGARIAASYSPDIVFALDWKEMRNWRIAQIDSNRPQHIGVAVKSLAAWQPSSQSVLRLPRLISEILGRTDAYRQCRISVLPFGESDRGLAGELTDSLRQAGVNVKPAEAPNIEELQREVSDLDCLIAVPFHASVFAIACGVPCVGLAYDAKVERLYRSFELQEMCLDVPSWSTEELARVLDIAVTQRRSLSYRLLELSDRARTEVEETIVKLFRGVLNAGMSA